MTSQTQEPRPLSQAPGQALRLRPLRAADEAAYRSALEVRAAEGFAFGFGLEPGVDWGASLQTQEERRRGLSLSPEQVPATFLVGMSAVPSSAGPTSAITRRSAATGLIDLRS